VLSSITVFWSPLAIAAIFNNDNWLSLKISKTYLTAGIRIVFIPKLSLYLPPQNPTKISPQISSYPGKIMICCEK
jgi:hypothetical protein